MDNRELVRELDKIIDVYETGAGEGDSDLGDKTDELLIRDLLAYISLCAKYNALDLEATKRELGDAESERDDLRKRLGWKAK